MNQTKFFSDILIKMLSSDFLSEHIVNTMKKEPFISNFFDIFNFRILRISKIIWFHEQLLMLVCKTEARYLAFTMDIHREDWKVGRQSMSTFVNLDINISEIIPNNFNIDSKQRDEILSDEYKIECNYDYKFQVLGRIHTILRTILPEDNYRKLLTKYKEIHGDYLAENI
jgi:hypothetical protein